MDVETRVGLQLMVKPLWAVFDKRLGLELVGEVNRGLRFELVGVNVIERGVRVPQLVVEPRELRVELVEGVVEISCVVNLPLLGVEM